MPCGALDELCLNVDARLNDERMHVESDWAAFKLDLVERAVKMAMRTSGRGRKHEHPIQHKHTRIHSKRLLELVSDVCAIFFYV